MSELEKIHDFLVKAKIFYFLTVDGDKPKGRPFSFSMMYDGKLIFGTGEHKECYRQMNENSHVEVVAFADGKFIRYDGVIEYIDDPAVKTKALEANPWMSQLYNAENGRKIRFFYLKDASVEECTNAGEVKKVTKL